MVLLCAWRLGRRKIKHDDVAAVIMTQLAIVIAVTFGSKLGIMGESLMGSAEV